MIVNQLCSICRIENILVSLKIYYNIIITNEFEITLRINVEGNVVSNKRNFLLSKQANSARVHLCSSSQTEILRLV